MMKLSEEEYCMMIGYKEVENYELRKVIGELQNELNIRRAEQQNHLRAIGGRGGDFGMASRESKIGAVQDSAREIFASAQTTKEIRGSE